MLLHSYSSHSPHTKDRMWEDLHPSDYNVDQEKLQTSDYNVDQKENRNESSSDRSYAVDRRSRGGLSVYRVGKRSVGTRGGSTLTGDDIVVLSLIGGGSAYILCTLCRTIL